MAGATTYVHVELDGVPHLVGRLFTHLRRRRESSIFEYAEEWLASEHRFPLEPALTLGPGAHHTPEGHELFGALGDSAPDRWGRRLMRRRERRTAEEEGRAPRTLREIDFLLGVSDHARQPFLSAMSMLGAEDGQTRSYAEIADALRQEGAETTADCKALWRRIVFNVLVSNTDDHLRNHGFLYHGLRGWRLSPAYDLLPVPADMGGRMLATTIDYEGDPSASMDLAFAHAPYFELDGDEARELAREVAEAVAGWREAARSRRIPGPEIDRMRSAFEHEELEKARTG